MNSKICAKCGKEIPENVKFCIHCGSKCVELEQRISDPNGDINARYCDNCGYEISENDLFCNNCGYQLYSEEPYETNIPTKTAHPKKTYKPLLVSLLILLMFAVCCVIIVPDLLEDIEIYFPTIQNTKETNYTVYREDTSLPEPTTTTTTKAPVVHNLPNEVYDSTYEEFDVSAGPFNKVKASSYANWTGTVGFPHWVFDGKKETSWQDGKKNSYGINEWFLSYNSDGATEFISSVTIYNGYLNTSHNTSSKDFYMLNSRVKDFSLEFDDGRVLKFTLSDTKAPQTFKFGETIETCFVKFKIKGVYEGKWSDTCISEISYN